MARMAKNARRLVIQTGCQTGCQKWPFWQKCRIWHKWRKITWPLVWHKQRKIAKGLAISRMRQIFKLDAKFSFELLITIWRLIAISAIFAKYAIFATACISGHIPGPDQYSVSQAPPGRDPTLTLLIYSIFCQKRYPFGIPSIDEWYSFHIPSSNLDGNFSGPEDKNKFS